MAECSLVAEMNVEQVDDCWNQFLHSKSHICGERAYSKLPKTSLQETQHETTEQSCEDSPGEIVKRLRIGTFRVRVNWCPCTLKETYKENQ